MRGFGYQEKVHIGSREFHIHTGCDTDRQRALSEIFEQGKFIYAANEPYPLRKDKSARVDEAFLREVIARFHNEIKEEVRVIFYIHDKIRPFKKYRAHYRLGKVFYDKNFYEEAIENFKLAKDLNPDFIKAYKRLGLSYLTMQRYDEALKVFKQALEIQPEYPDILDCLGVTYTQTGDYRLAKNYLQKAIEIKTNYIESNFNLGIVLFLSTLDDSADEERVILPARLMRSLKDIKKQKYYRDAQWQTLFDSVIRTTEEGNKNVVMKALSDLQLKIISRSGTSPTVDYFFLKFMYGGKEMSKEDLEYYEQRIRDEAGATDGYADYWNELGMIHLIRCRDYFLSSLNEFEKSISINPDYKVANENRDLLIHGKKGFLILLRAILD